MIKSLFPLKIVVSFHKLKLYFFIVLLFDGQSILLSNMDNIKHFLVSKVL